MHDALALGFTIGSPLFAVMFGVLLNQRALDKQEERMNARFSRIDARMDRLEARMDRLENRVDSIKEDQSRFLRPSPPAMQKSEFSWTNATSLSL